MSRVRNDENGFTLIELLVVVIIIGILATIAIPVFLNQRQAAWTAAVESDLRNTAIALETFYVYHGHYGVSDLEELAEAVGAQFTDGVTVGGTAAEWSTINIAAMPAPDPVHEPQTFCLEGFHESLNEGTGVVSAYHHALGGLRTGQTCDELNSMLGT